MPVPGVCMSPRVLLILVILLLVIFGGMALTMKRSADKRRDRTASLESLVELERRRIADHHLARIGVVGIQEHAMLVGHEYRGHA